MGMDVGGIRNTGPLVRTTSTGAAAPAAEAAPAAATSASPSLSSDSSSISTATLEYWSKNYKSATPENIQKIKDTFQQATGRQPTENEIELALFRMDSRGADFALDSIKTSTEAAVRKYGSQVDKLIEEAAKELRDSGVIDQQAYDSLVTSPERKSWYADMFMEGKTTDQVKDRIKARLQKEDFKPRTEDPIERRDDVAEPNTPPVREEPGTKVDDTKATAPTEESTRPEAPEKTISVGGRGMGGGSDTSFNVTPGELAAMYDILKNDKLVTLQDMQKQLKELYGIDTEIKNGTLVSPDGRALIADTNGNGVLDINDIDFGKAIEQVKQEFGIDITKYGRLDRLQALAQSKGLDDVLAIFERSRKAAEEAAKEAEKARQEGRAIDAATQAKLDAEQAEITKLMSKAIEDNLGYDVSGEGATGQFVHEGDDIEKPLHDHEADTVNFEGDGDYQDITDDVITSEVEGDVFAGLEGEKHADPVKGGAKAEEAKPAEEAKKEEAPKNQENLGEGLDAEEKAALGIE